MNQVLRLQEEKTSLKQSSEEEVGQLWSQLESMRTSRQELGGEIDARQPDIYCIYLNTHSEGIQNISKKCKNHLS